MDVKDWIFSLVIIVLISMLAFFWYNGSSARESIVGVRTELQASGRRNDSITKELRISEERVAMLDGLLLADGERIDTLTKELHKATNYIARLEGQFNISEESVGRINDLIGRGGQLVEEGRGFLSETEN